MNLYYQLLLESFFSSLPIPISGQRVFFAMRAFGGYDMHKAAVLAVAGTFAALIANFVIGRFLLHLKQKEHIFVRNDIYARGQRWMAGRLLPLLLLSWLSIVGPLFAVAAGFFNVPAKKALPLLLLGQVGYYGYFLLR